MDNKGKFFGFLGGLLSALLYLSGSAHAQYAVPTPAAPFVDGASVIGGAFSFLPALIVPMAVFVVVSLAWKFAPRILNMARSLAKK